MKKLRPNQRRAIEDLAAGGTFESAAEAAGVSVRTVYTWRTDDAFKAELNDESQRLIGITMHKLTSAAVNMVDVLSDIATDSEVKESVRVSAAKAVLENVLKIRELHSIEERIAALEQASELLYE